MGSTSKIRIGVLTSSRADFGIYLPLLKLINKDTEKYALNIIVFGTHLSPYHGMTKNEILKNGFAISYEVPSLLLTDDVHSISTSYALTALKFADFWKSHTREFDVVFCLGDRFEMAAAVAAGIPYSIKFAHIHGGETTLGAIDNIYRHSITLASTFHFVATEAFRIRVLELVKENPLCHVTGALSLDNLDEIRFLDSDRFFNLWGIDLKKRSILVTIHPETVASEKNAEYAKVSKETLIRLSNDFQVIVTLPNADTNGSVFRAMFAELKNEKPESIFLVENFGTQSFFTCMHYVDFVFGNSSSGIIEAASFGKYVVNVGDRQKGRLTGENVLHVPFEKEEIITAVERIKNRKYTGENIYKKGSAAENILAVINRYFDERLY